MNLAYCFSAVHAPVDMRDGLCFFLIAPPYLIHQSNSNRVRILPIGIPRRRTRRLASRGELRATVGESPSWVNRLAPHALAELLSVTRHVAAHMTAGYYHERRNEPGTFHWCGVACQIRVRVKIL